LICSRSRPFNFSSAGDSLTVFNLTKVDWSFFGVLGGCIRDWLCGVDALDAVLGEQDAFSTGEGGF